MGLNDDQIKQWREEGYVIVEKLFSEAQIQLMIAELQRFCDEGLGNNRVTEGDGQTHSEEKINYQIIPLNEKSELFRALPFLPEVNNVVMQLLGKNVVRVLDQIFLKPAKNGVGTNWHTDNAYFKTHDVSRGTGCWISLHEANRENGTMMLIPRSHEKVLEHVRDLGSDHHVTCAEYINPEEAIHVEVPAGGAVFFNFGVAHATGPNPTDRDRAGLAFHFCTPELAGDVKATNEPVLITGDDEGHDIPRYRLAPNLDLWKVKHESL